MASDGGGWQFWVDRGGTFTDVVARDPAGRLQSLKLLSDNPSHYDDAAVAGIERVLRGAAAAEAEIDAIKMGTTVGTNALLERRGEPTVLVITAGLKDAIRIGSQQRPDIFALDIRLPDMLYDRVVEAHERLAADGGVVAPLDEERLAADLRAVRADGIDSIAIVLMHAYRNGAHERRAAEIARQAGFTQISVSHEVNPVMRLIERGNTTLLDAYLSPVLSRYIGRMRAGLHARHGDAPLYFMQSHGGLVDADSFQGKDCVLSGPAGGVVGMAAAAAGAGLAKVIGFDMGGTSTDVSLYDGEFERCADALIAGFRISSPMLRIHTVAAGGGSILQYANERLQVGPESAGALPGPACYRNGGPLTVTDANLLLGRIQADFFPRVFGPNADQAVDPEIVADKFAALAGEVARSFGDWPVEKLAAGFIRVAVERMANAIKQISIQRGHDAAQFALCCFGGAAGQHACQVADALGIDTVLIHRLAGVLSAYGMGVADVRSIRRHTVETGLSAAGLERVRAQHGELGRAAREDLTAQGIGAVSVTLKARLFLKVRGADTALGIEWDPSVGAERCRKAFDATHARHFGFVAEAADIVVDTLEVEAVGAMPQAEAAIPAPGEAAPRPAATREVWLDDAWTAVPIYERDRLRPGTHIDGPAVIVEDNSTTLVETHWRASISAEDSLVLSRGKAAAAAETVGRERDPIMLEVFNSSFMHVAEQMGVILTNTAHSVNIKERVDFSCAVFDAAGELIANAPHVPVHLGSMGDSVKAILEHAGGALRAGDVYMLNDPYRGGTHLPDITVVSPVFDPDGGQLRFLLANRAHHADIGGLTPGSMPAHSRSLDEEGVVFEPCAVVRGGRFRERELRRALTGGAYPARNPDQNIADLKAQIAANAKGAAELDKTIARFGLETVVAYMQHIKANAEESVRAAIAALRNGRWSLAMDGGETIAVEIGIDRRARSASIDFAGTSPASPGNFNAPASVARAAILYVFRTLVEQNIPLNEGCLKPLRIRLPAGSLLDPEFPAAVVAGNVETSQCIVDALLAALDACAASQGTMNNFTFGNERYQYYETLCGGAGAGPDFDGASAVHTHMTNSKLTDPEVLEWRYPVRLRRFEVRPGSGGRGAHRGGDGIVRDLEFLEAMQAAIVSNRRRVAPFGLHGGGNGAAGKNYLIRVTGKRERLGATAEVRLEAGDRFVIETPGGGAYGRGG